MTFPNGATLEKQSTAEGMEDTFIFKGPQDISSTIYIDSEGAISGTLHDSSGRVYKVQVCGADCHVWIELDTNKFQDGPLPQEHHISEASFQELALDRDTGLGSERVAMLVKKGSEDRTTIVNLSVKIYYTFEVEETTTNLEGFLQDVISETNLGYVNSQIPLRIFLHCTERYFHPEQTDAVSMLFDFRRYRATSKEVLGGADVAILIGLSFNSCGFAFSNNIVDPFAIVRKSCAQGYFSVGHEVAHIFGAQHNQEVTDRGYFPYGFGYLVGGNTDARTILSYSAPGHSRRINYYSNRNPEVTFNGQLVGNATRDNARVLLERRFLMEALGTESEPCVGEPPVIDGRWSLWSPWSQCNEGGQRVRVRKCNFPRPANGGQDCSEENYIEEKKPCECENIGPDDQCDKATSLCSDSQRLIPGYCRKSCELCGPKVCKNLRLDCDRLAEADFCYKSENLMAYWCPLSCGACLAGQWGEWENRSTCNPDSGIQFQDRNCQGSACPGSSTRKVDCPVNGAWSDWSESGSCNEMSGTRPLTRTCSDPSPKNGGVPCEGKTTRTEDCAVDGSWSAWESWGSCSNGERLTTRTCSSPSPLNGGNLCSGNRTKKEGCGTIVLNNWNSWSFWSECRNGEQMRRRSCNVASCEGPATELSRCHLENDENCFDIQTEEYCRDVLSRDNCENKNIAALCWKTCKSCSVCRDNWDQNNCNMFVSICRNTDYQHFMAFLCRRTCGFCSK
ncbi:coadhesin-like [Tigriopus californicus]|uniref:coadhesin-like n=1 Tax=Tigriopus californicus TaxID=6832 RepID=UPI0027DAADD0|nr:coadhesin-like [Tigriopus californicus]